VRIACLSTDPGIAWGGAKGASVHLAEIVEALRAEDVEMLVLVSQIVADAPAPARGVTLESLPGPRKGIPVDVTTMTVGKYLQQWLEDVARHQVRPTTYRSYEQLVRLYLVPGLGKKKLRALQAQHVRTWLSGLATKCQCCAQNKDVKRTLNPGDPTKVDLAKARCCARMPKECCEQYPSAVRGVHCCGCCGQLCSMR